MTDLTQQIRLSRSEDSLRLVARAMGRYSGHDQALGQAGLPDPVFCDPQTHTYPHSVSQGHILTVQLESHLPVVLGAVYRDAHGHGGFIQTGAQQGLLPEGLRLSHIEGENRSVLHIAPDLLPKSSRLVVFIHQPRPPFHPWPEAKLYLQAHLRQALVFSFTPSLDKADHPALAVCLLQGGLDKALLDVCPEYFHNMSALDRAFDMGMAW